MTAVAGCDATVAWSVVLAVARLCRDGSPTDRGVGIADGPEGPIVREPDGPGVWLRIDGGGAWRSDRDVAPAAATLFDLHLPFAVGGPGCPRVWAQLGQSLDGRIATVSGRSHYVTGAKNIDHVHRLRAVADAVLVGAGTVEQDDPRLTVRRAAGDQPTRVILDPHRRLTVDRHVFRDRAAPTLLICDAGLGSGTAVPEGVDLLPLAAAGDGIRPAAIVSALRARGLHRVLVEGGGVTVSRFLAAGVLDRLHLCVAPMLIGSGRPGIALPVIDDLDRALRPRCRAVPMGPDTLFDCDLR